jgi:hypothetical protein
MKAFCKPPKKPGEHPTAAVATTTTTRQTTSINIDSFLPINSTAHTTFVTISKYAFHSLFLQHWLCGQKMMPEQFYWQKRIFWQKRKRGRAGYIVFGQLQILVSDRRISTGCSVRLKMWSHEKKFII